VTPSAEAAIGAAVVMNVCHILAAAALLTSSDVEKEIRARVAVEKSRRELIVHYYRIGYSLAYPLPLATAPRTGELPQGIREIRYPWYTWLSWALEERWRLLHIAWRRFDDREAATMLQRELAALSGWNQFTDSPNSVSLSTAHIAACLADALAIRDGWAPEKLQQARAAAETLLERDVWPWFTKKWSDDRKLKPADLHNIPVIALARSAQLARALGSPRASALDARMQAALRAWCRHRLSESRQTEGSAYDGYLMDSVTGWLQEHPDHNPLLGESRDAFASLASQWIHLTLPGQPHVQAPLGDVEPEMPFWQTSLARLATWYRWPESAWLVRRLPVTQMPAACLVAVLDLNADSVVPKAGTLEHPHAITMRTGWKSADILVVVGLPRNMMGHLHADAGHVIIGWQNRFWITDPGYQQYRLGEERDFTVGAEAHNAPIIAGKAPSRRAPKLLSLRQREAAIDLTACYPTLPVGAAVRREVSLQSDGVVIRDFLQRVGRETEVHTCWQVDAGLAWSFQQGWARLSDGQHQLWIGTFPGAVKANQLDRHPGSRGPLTLRHTETLADGTAERWWVFAQKAAEKWRHTNHPPAAR